MNLKKIKTKKDHADALALFTKVFHAKAGTKDGDIADVLALLIEDYENRMFTIEASDPIEAIKYRMEQQNLSKKDIGEILGFKSRVSDIFSGRRKLTIEMVRNLHEKLNIPLAALVK